MKYLVNRETKAHYIQPGMMVPYGPVYDEVEADAEGWIKWEGLNNPFSEDAECECKWSVGCPITRGRAGNYWWGHEGMTHYRPILDKPTVKESLTVAYTEYDPRSVSFNVLERLEAAHEAAQSIPDLEAELREVLGSIGYDLVARSPFVEPDATDAAPQIKIDWPACNPACDEEFNGYRSKGCMCEAAKASMLKQAQPAEDMSDWRNWRAGDLIECVDTTAGGRRMTKGQFYRLTDTPDGNVVDIINDDGDKEWFSHARFRFHSRPEQSK